MLRQCPCSASDAGCPVHTANLTDGARRHIDIYSLGVVPYEMLAGRLPFEALTTAGIFAKPILESPPDLAALRRDHPAPLVAAVAHAVAKSPAVRHRSPPDAKASAPTHRHFGG